MILAPHARIGTDREESHDRIWSVSTTLNANSAALSGVLAWRLHGELNASLAMLFNEYYLI